MHPPVCVLVFARMQGSRRERVREMARHDLIRFLDSYASLLVLLIANFLLLQIVDDAALGRRRQHAARSRRADRRDQRSGHGAPGQSRASGF